MSSSPPTFTCARRMFCAIFDDDDKFALRIDVIITVGENDLSKRIVRAGRCFDGNLWVSRFRLMAQMTSII